MEREKPAPLSKTVEALNEGIIVPTAVYKDAPVPICREGSA